MIAWNEKNRRYEFNDDASSAIDFQVALLNELVELNENLRRIASNMPGDEPR